MKRRITRRISKVAPPKTALIDAFTERDLEAWEAHSIDLQAYHDRVYYDLERQRVARYEELCEALRNASTVNVSVDHWVRVTDWRWNLTPLSAAGSLNGIGGRFNLGRDLDRARKQEFPCLYLAQDVETAYQEYFGAPLNSRHGGLSLQELLLRRQDSFTTFHLRGAVSQVFDVRKHFGLAKFAKLIASFDVTEDTKRFARRAGFIQRPLIKTSIELWKRILAAPGNWRREPQWFGIPAVSQIFGRFVRDSGFEALLYPSQRGGNECLALFPENLKSSDSRVEVVGAMPPEARMTVLDKDHVS